MTITKPPCTVCNQEHSDDAYPKVPMPRRRSEARLDLRAVVAGVIGMAFIVGGLWWALSNFDTEQSPSSQQRLIAKANAQYEKIERDHEDVMRVMCKVLIEQGGEDPACPPATTTTTSPR